MQQVRLWEITADRKLPEIPARHASLEEWIEDWLADDISVLDPNLLVISRQVRTSFGGLVGRGRFELPTSALSELRSNQLSYRPNEDGTYRACKAMPYL